MPITQWGSAVRVANIPAGGAKLATVALGAFVDLAPYVDMGDLYRRYGRLFAVILDSSVRTIVGYVMRAGTGEALGGELLADPGFAAAGSWVAGGGWEVTGGKGVATTTTSTLNTGAALTQGWLVKRQFTIDSITGTVRAYTTNVPGTDHTTTGTKTEYLTCGAVGARFGLLGVTSLTAQVDDATVKRVTEPPTTGVVVSQGKRPGVQSWLTITASFDANAVRRVALFDVQDQPAKLSQKALAYAGEEVMRFSLSAPKRYFTVSALDQVFRTREQPQRFRLRELGPRFRLTEKRP